MASRTWARAIPVILAIIIITCSLAVVAPSSAQALSPIYVRTDGNDANDGSADDAGHAKKTIQAAVYSVNDGGTIYVAAGTYGEPFELVGRSGIGIIGQNRDTTIIKPSSTLAWNVATYGATRQTAVRVVNSTNVRVQNLTFDFGLIKNDWVCGVLLWDSSGAMTGNVLRDMSVLDTLIGGYSEFGAYVRAPGFTATNRARVDFTGNTFVDTGRVGILAHDYADLSISGNTFYKTTKDFGYAMEIGSTSTATITGNTVYGYDTPALSDESDSAGIYIENSFTSTIVAPAVSKPVQVSGNEVYGCQCALHVGNEFDGYAGDVDIQLTASGNNFHDNTENGVVIADEDASAGSSVAATFSGDTIKNNGGCGVYIYTKGDGAIHTDFAGETITGHATGVTVEDKGSTSTSTYDVSFVGCDLSGNTVVAVDNRLAASTIQATGNWWGHASGPYNATSNAAGLGGPVSDKVNFSPWDAGRLQLSAPFRVRLGRTADVTARLTLSDGTALKTPVPVTFTATGGSIDPAAPVMTVGGAAAARWTTGADEGPVNITASAAGLEATVCVYAYEPAPKEPPPPPATTGGFTVGSADGIVTVDVPKNISDVPIRLTVAPSEDPPPTAGNVLVGRVFDVEMYAQATGSGVHDLRQSLTVAFHVSAADLAAAGVSNPSDLRIWYWDPDAKPPCWVALPTVYDPATGALTVTVDHLTTFAAMVDPDFPALADAAGHWAEKDILRLASRRVVSGYEDGSFRPEVAVTRAQFAKFIVLSLGLTRGTALPAGFTDAASVQAWAVPYVSACLRDGIMTGSGGLIRPNDSITRAEASAMVVRALGLGPQGGSDGAGAGGPAFTDSSSIPIWAAGFAAEAFAHGLIEGLPGNVFDPSGKLTRAQAATALSRAIDIE